MSNVNDAIGVMFGGDLKPGLTLQDIAPPLKRFADATEEVSSLMRTVDLEMVGQIAQIRAVLAMIAAE